MKFTLVLLACALIFVGCASNNVATEEPSQKTSIEKEGDADIADVNISDVNTQDADIKEPGKTKETEGSAETKKEDTKTEDAKPEDKGSTSESKNQQDIKTADDDKSGEGKEESPSYTTKSSLKAACDDAKFSMQIPESIGDYKINEYRSSEGFSVEAVYEIGGGSKQSIAIKKSLGNLETVNPASDYEINRFVNDAGNRVFLRGDSTNKIYIASWNSGDYFFSIESSAGLPRESILLLVREVN